MKYHCASCDRPSRTVKGGKTPSLPVLDAQRNTKSTKPYLIYGQAEVRDHVNHNSVNNEEKQDQAGTIKCSPLWKKQVQVKPRSVEIQTVLVLGKKTLDTYT